MQRRVLIIDDERETCELIERVVGCTGMEAVTLRSSAQAVDLLERNKFDLVILDFHMASPDGVELARQVRQMRMNRTTPVVLISDDQRPSAVSVGFEAGASFILYKPLDKERLLKILRATQSTIDRERRRTRRTARRGRRSHPRASARTARSPCGRTRICPPPLPRIRSLSLGRRRLTWTGGAGARSCRLRMPAWGRPGHRDRR